MKRWIAGMIVMGLLSGCLTPPMKQAKEEAYKRWNGARAQVACGVANEYLKVGQLVRARAKALEALSLDENYSPARLVLARVYIEQAEYAAAQAELRKLQQRLPASDEVHYLMGVAQEKDGQLEQALASYRLAHHLNDANVESVLAATEVLVAMGQPGQAQEELAPCLGRSINDPAACELAGRLAMMLGDYGEAAKYYELACEADSVSLQYRQSLARALFLDQRYAEAAESLKKLVAAKDRPAEAWQYTMLGDCCMAMNRPGDAREAYLQASELNPESARAWANLSKVALVLRDAPRAIRWARQALILEPGRLEATLLLGYALMKDGQASEAVRLLSAASVQAPDNTTVQCLLGRAHAAAGDPAEAARCYLAALKLEPENVLAKQLLDRCGAGASRVIR